MKKFNEFSINELKSSVFKAAAGKLKKLGGIHISRAHELELWAKIKEKEEDIENGKEYGIFSMNFNITEIQRAVTTAGKKDIEKTVDIEPMSLKNTHKLIKEGPNKAHIITFYFEDWEDLNVDLSKELFYLRLMVIIMPTDDKIFEEFDAFHILVPIKWTENEFTIDNSKETIVESGWNDWHTKILFSNRIDASKFKRKVLNKSGLDKLIHKSSKESIRNLFMQHSYAEEIEKFYNKVLEVSVNQLFS